MDGTLIDSSLSLEKIREDIGIPPKTPILEHIEKLKLVDKNIARAIVLEHELRAVENAKLNPGVEDLLLLLRSCEIEVGLFTRNCLKATQRVLERFKLKFNGVITRDCAPPKPNPQGLISIVQSWDLQFDQVVYVGDFLFDIHVGKKAGVRTALYSPFDIPKYANEADYVFSNFNDFSNRVLEVTPSGIR